MGWKMVEGMRRRKGEGKKKERKRGGMEGMGAGSQLSTSLQHQECSLRDS